MERQVGDFWTIGRGTVDGRYSAPSPHIRRFQVPLLGQDKVSEGGGDGEAVRGGGSGKIYFVGFRAYRMAIVQVPRGNVVILDVLHIAHRAKHNATEMSSKMSSCRAANCHVLK